MHAVATKNNHSSQGDDRLRLPSSQDHSIRRVKSGSEDFMLCIKDRGSYREQPAIEFSIPLADLVKDLAVRILRSEWANEASPRQALPQEFQIIRENSKEDSITANMACADGVRIGRGLTALPEQDRSFLREGKSLLYGEIEFYQMKAEPPTWGFRRTDSGTHIRLDKHLLIDLACRILRDPMTAEIWPNHALEFLGALPSDAWDIGGRLIDPRLCTQSLDAEDAIYHLRNTSSAASDSLQGLSTLEQQLEIVKQLAKDFCTAVNGLSDSDLPGVPQIKTIASMLIEIPEIANHKEIASSTEVMRAVALNEIEARQTELSQTIREELKIATTEVSTFHATREGEIKKERASLTTRITEAEMATLVAQETYDKLDSLVKETLSPTVEYIFELAQQLPNEDLSSIRLAHEEAIAKVAAAKSRIDALLEGNE